jgi:hypothetical protein
MHRPTLPTNLPGRPRTVLVLTVLLIAAVLPSSASAVAPNAVVVWDEHALDALANGPTASPPGAGQAPPVHALHMAMVEAAMYDAANSIDRGHEPYLDGLPAAQASASVDAAVATAAHHVLTDLVPSLPDAIDTRLNGLYADYLDGIPAGASKDAGIAAGAEAASAMLADRVGDGRFGSFRFSVGEEPGQWRPTSGANDPNGWVARVRPFAMNSTSHFRTEGPPALTSEQYTKEYNEVKALGAAGTASTRTTDQTALGTFYVESPVLVFHRTLRALATREGLSTVDSARLFGMVSLATGDAAIGCWDNKEHWSFWRPITAIRLGDSDGNPDTVGDSDWSSHVAAPPYADMPSGYNCLTGATVSAARAFFGTDRMSFTVHSNATNADRPYDRWSDVLDDTIDSRIYIGLHFRSADVAGAWLGRKAAEWVAKHELEPVN